MLFAILKKVLKIYTANKENVNSLILREAWRVTMKTKLKHQINKKIIMKNIEKLLQKQNDRYIHFKELLKSYNGLQNRLKALKENISTSETSTYHIDDGLTIGKDLY